MTGHPTETAANLDQEERQLDALRSTYPGWDILIDHKNPGQRWVAELHRPMTRQLASAGVLPRPAGHQ
ncbi:hypothetical protein [Nonomuraea sp. NPDC001831]|uniref:hypothetical protein n=1 Tax=Nonomuraea sp. NPDC001831 TaxID=3364340 RepID=UPI0036A92171